MGEENTKAECFHCKGPASPSKIPPTARHFLFPSGLPGEGGIGKLQRSGHQGKLKSYLCIRKELKENWPKVAGGLVGHGINACVERDQ